MPSDEEILIERMREWMDFKSEGLHMPNQDPPAPGTAAAGYKLTPIPTQKPEPKAEKVETWRDRAPLF